MPRDEIADHVEDLALPAGESHTGSSGAEA
jgi:hypothetical protein